MLRRSILAILLFASPVLAQEPIRFARTPDLSPDGKSVAFSYFGDIWIVDAQGGIARPVTMHEKHEMFPVFSPDGKHLAFSSNRHGGYDVYVTPVQGGRPTRLTHDSADDFVCGWTHDGSKIVFTSGRGQDFPFRQELFTTPRTGGRAEQISVYEGRDGAYSPSGDKIAYTRGPGAWYRKGYRGSSNDDLWISDANGSNNRPLSKFNGQDSFAMWSPDGKTIYYVSEVYGTPANLVQISADQENALPVALTNHKDEAVRRARLGANGQAIVYECGPDLWILTLKDKKTRKLRIEVHADDKTNQENLTTFTSKATEFAMSPDEKHIAFVVQGEIFLMARTGGKAKRLTDHPAYDHGLAWSPDGKKLLFLSDRQGHEDVYVLEQDDPDHPTLTAAHRFKTTQLTKTPEEERGVSFSPDGKRIGMLRAGKLLTMKADGTGEKTFDEAGVVIDYEWSPDGQWVAYSRMDGSFASELFVAPAAGPTPLDPARNITRFATYNAGVTWSKTGNKLAFISQRKRNASSAYVVSLGSSGKGFDYEDIHLRARQPVSMSISECAISGDGSKIAFRGSEEGKEDLWVANTDGSQLTRITTGGMRPTQIQWSKLFSTQIYFRDNTGNIRTASATAVAGQGTSSAIVPFQAQMLIKQDEVFTEMFDQSWRLLHDNFYDRKFHGADWNLVRAKYRPIVKHCALKEDLYALISLMLGELNASHLGISGKSDGANQVTADLGMFFERGYDGDGLKVRNIVRRGPADKRDGLKVGDIIVSVDGVKLTPQVELSTLLNDKVGETVTLDVTSNLADARAKRRVEVVASSRGGVSNLLYESWLRKNADEVRKLSESKLGYIHIPSMDEAGLERFERALYSDNFDKDGLVLDVRFNGGGFTHEKVLNYLGGREHTLFYQRDGGFGLVLRSDDRRWTKPIVLLINNRSFSDAEIFPHAFRTLGLGKLVGQPTGGHVIGTRNVTLIDGSMFRTPRIGVTTHKGVNMDKEGVMPDVLVENHPDELARGHDAQLQRAVEVLREDVESWRKTRPPVAVNPIGGASGAGANRD